MTNSSEPEARTLDPEPWRGLPSRVADLIEGEIPATTAEILESIGREVPEYARPLEGNFGRGVRRGVAEALAQFVAVIRDPDAGRPGAGRGVYLALGRGEHRQGRTLDSLQAAYRIGARVAWRRFADAGRRARLPADSLSLLAESIFAYIDELSADSVDGYAEAQAELEDQGRRRRRELTRLLVAAESPDPASLAAVARAARWTLPPRLAAMACAEGDLDAVARRLPPESLAAVVDGVGCLLLADPEGPGRLEPLRRLGGSAVVALGPPTAPAGAGQSWSLARALLDAVSAGRVEARGLIEADEHLADLVLLAAGPLTARIAERRLSAFDGLTEGAGERMRATALAYVRHGGNAVAMAAELHVHAQTARYRIARLRELLGEQLDDPDGRFELELALRAGA
jgi:PucR C-terminal helix-turn-helix domain